MTESCCAYKYTDTDKGQKYTRWEDSPAFINKADIELISIYAPNDEWILLVGNNLEKGRY